MEIREISDNAAEEGVAIDDIDIGFWWDVVEHQHQELSTDDKLDLAAELAGCEVGQVIEHLERERRHD